MSAFERLSSAMQYQVANTLGFRDLRPVQDQSIEAILGGNNVVVLAPTAGGKTEAAFFPILSLMDSEDWRPVSVLYLSPIRALLNNQEQRVCRYAEMIGRRAFKWHGDTAQSARKRFLRDPTDIVLATPESLEAMLMSQRISSRALFAGLRAVIIDEVHAFADDGRGAHLASLMERIQRFCGRDVQRIGLSATVGNPEEILGWLKGSSERRSVVVNPGGGRIPPDLALDYVGCIENAVTMIEKLHPGRKRLVFVDSRGQAERVGNLLSGRGVATFVTHGSLSARERHEAERAFHEGSDCVIVATSALELGIDVGDLDHVLQIDSPPSVASFLQRMGRTGRRGNAANCTFLVTKEESVLQTAAIIDLFRQGFVEPVRPLYRGYHILAHQIMALGIQHSGVPVGDWWSWISGAAPFRDVTAEERDALLHHMQSTEILADHGGRIWLGPLGEKRFGGANFRALYAVFDSPRLITIRAGTNDIGQVDASFLFAIDSDAQRGAFMLAGRSWQVVTIDWERGICVVKPAEVGRAPRWNGGPQFLGYDLCQAMKRLLCSDDQDPAWSKRASTVVETLRAEFEFLRDGATLRESSDEICWWTFAGGAANLLLARMLESDLGEKVTSRDNCVTLKEGAGKSFVAVEDLIRRIAERSGPSLDDARKHANSGTAKARFSKFDVCLPEQQLEMLLVEGVLDVEGARRAVTGLGRDGDLPQGEEFER